MYLPQRRCPFRFFFFLNLDGDIRHGHSDMRDAKKALQEGQSPYEDLYKRGKIRTRAKETLEKAKDCISKELVWKVI